MQCCYLNDPQLCFFLVIVVHESLVFPEQLNFLLFFGKILQLPQILWFSSIFVYLNPFQQWLYDFEIHLYTQRTTEGLLCNYYLRLKRSLMLQKENHTLRALHFHLKWKHFEFDDQGKFNLIFLLGKHVTIFCSFLRAVLNEKKYTSSLCLKVFTPWLLMHVCFFILERLNLL